MKVSIVTVVYNGRDHIESCIQSVRAQSHPDIEHIIIDGGSTDGTIDIIGKYLDGLAYFVSEPDKGIYDAMNKGIALATGDIIGTLNADDFYSGAEVISRVRQEFEEKKIDSIFGDLVFVKPENLNKIVRYYSAKNFKLSDFERGDMPPHPTFFVKREIYDRLGVFDTGYRIVSDYEIMIRFLYRGDVSWSYIPEVLVKMRTGGISTKSWRSNVELNREMLRACEANGIKTSLAKIYSKYFRKIFQLVSRPKNS